MIVIRRRLLVTVRLVHRAGRCELRMSLQHYPRSPQLSGSDFGSLEQSPPQSRFLRLASLMNGVQLVMSLRTTSISASRCSVSRCADQISSVVPDSVSRCAAKM